MIHWGRDPGRLAGHAGGNCQQLPANNRGLPRGATLFWLVTGCCLGFSASYELLEMAVVVGCYPEAGPEWLGMQGDPWDAQMDMTMALTGAITAQLLLRGLHDRSIARATGVACGP